MKKVSKKTVAVRITPELHNKIKVIGQGSFSKGIEALGNTALAREMFKMHVAAQMQKFQDQMLALGILN